jgi:hypothetical protein
VRAVVGFSRAKLERIGNSTRDRRLTATAETWRDAMGNLRGERLLGRIFAASRIKLRAIAKQLGVRHLVNLTGCPLR